MRILIILVIVVVAGAAGWLALGDGGGPGPVSYFTEPVERGDIRATVSATGRVDAIVSLQVGSQLSGQLAAVHADFNDEVKAGEPLARLDDRTFTARVGEAEARLQSARANLAAARAATEGAEARLSEARQRFERSEALHRNKQVSATEMDRARAELSTARSELAMARAEVLARQADVSVAEAALNEARVDLERSVIRAPIDGVVIERQVDAGQTVAASLEAPTLFTIAHDLRQMKVHARVDEADIGRIRVGQAARFTVDAFPERVFEGRVKEIRKAPETVENVVTYTVVVTTRNPDLALLPGMTALLEIVVAERTDVLRVPNAALRYRPPAGAAAPPPADADALAWTLEGDTPAAVAVATGIADTTHTEVTAGLAAGQPVIVGHAAGPREDGPLGLRLGF